jgi:hypothetical protein
VIATATVGSCTDTATRSVDVTVLHPSLENLSLTPNTTICSGVDSATLTISATLHDAETATYLWNPITGLNVNTGTAVNASPAATTTYTVYAMATETQNGVTCVADASRTVTVTVNKPELDLSSISVYNNANNTEITNGTVCGGTEVRLTANTTLYDDNVNFYRWKIGNTVVKPYSTSPDYVVVPTANTTYTVEVYAVKTVNNQPCTTEVQTKDVAITVDDPQVTLAAITPKTICAGSTQTFTAQTTELNGALEYKWMNENGDSLANTQS